jgi:hypothetical protein
VLVRILDADPVFDEWFNVRNEQNVLRLLIGEAEAPCSIPFAVRAARENVRTTRDVLPDEVWELVNELYLYSRRGLGEVRGPTQPPGLPRGGHPALPGDQRRAAQHPVPRSQLPLHQARAAARAGRHDHADRRRGRLGFPRSARARQQGIEHLLWGTLLKSLSALGAYRRMIGPQVEKNAAVDFVFMEPTFPRSVRFCIREIRASWVSSATTSGAARHRALRRKLRGFRGGAFDQPAARYIDELQLLINDLHEAIDETWFLSAGMRRFACDCGSPVYFENDFCINCSSALGYDPERSDMVTLADWGQGVYRDLLGNAFRYCATASASASATGCARPTPHSLVRACRSTAPCPTSPCRRTSSAGWSWSGPRSACSTPWRSSTCR